ncbi:MAG: exosome complex RNA-binding protein Csl4, partial [Candidatus Micrarchaeota archaeon]
MTKLYPGDFIATVEEREPGANTFEENGSIYACVAGENASTQHAAAVKGKAIRKLARGDEVVGLVQDLYDTVALIEFQPVEKLASASNTYAYMRISEIQRGYTESFRGFLHIGDVFKAKVVDVTPLGIYLTIAERGLGVVRAFCTRCRKQMT